MRDPIVQTRVKASKPSVEALAWDAFVTSHGRSGGDGGIGGGVGWMGSMEQHEGAGVAGRLGGGPPGHDPSDVVRSPVRSGLCRPSLVPFAQFRTTHSS